MVVVGQGLLFTFKGILEVDVPHVCVSGVFINTLVTGSTSRC